MVQKSKVQKKSVHPGERLAKRIAAAGVCSRRDAEKLIEEGLVSVNGKVVKSPALNILETDQIFVRGQEIDDPSPTRLFLFHKPPGLVVSARDEQGRPTVFEGLPRDLPRLVSVGRLDLNSEGLLLLTTSGDLARYLELPATGLPRTYRVRAFGSLQRFDPAKLARGVKIGRIQYGPIDAMIEKKGTSNHWLRLTLNEGKNREVRKVLEHFGLQVSRLVREAYGPFELGATPKGAMVEIPLGKLKKTLPGYFKK